MGALLTALALGVRAQSPQGLLRELFNNIPGNSLADLTNSFFFPDSPSVTNILADGFETPSNAGDNYGQRLRGFVIPPLTGDYIFWIASDDQSALYLGQDEDPESRRQIAAVSGFTDPREWNREPGQRSAPRRLIAGRAYYIEALMKEGGGADHLAVRWQLPNGVIEEPIPSLRLVPLGTPLSPPVITLQPADQIADEGGAVIFTLRVRNADPVGYQWLRNNAPVAGANFASYTNTAVLLADHNALYRCIVTNALGSAASAEARLSVIPDLLPPTIVNGISTSPTNIVLVFSEPVLNAARLSSYALDRGAAITDASYGVNTRTIVLTTSPLQIRVPYTLTVRGVFDAAAARNTLAADTQVVVTPLELRTQDVGTTEPSGLILPAADGFDLVAGGGDIGGTNDLFLLGYQVRAGNFDLRVRVESLDLTDPWAKTGLMARESLDANSRFAFSAATPGISGCAFITRALTGAVAAVTGHFPVNHPGTWLRLRRDGDLFQGFASADGASWAVLGEISLRITNDIYVGLAATSRNTNQTAVARLREFSVVQPGTAATGPLPANIEPLGPSSRRTGLVISEIMYHPLEQPGAPNLEFIEIFNSQPFAEDLGGYSIDGEVRYEFPPGTRLAGGGFIVVAGSAAALQARHRAARIAGSFAGRLANGRGTLRLRHRLGAVLLETRYDSRPPWPASADGGGHSLVLARPSYGEGRPEAWAASDTIGGSPGAPETLLPEPFRALRINEFLAHTDPPLLDYVELYNHSARDLDLGGCILTDNPGANRFVFPRGVRIAGGGFLALDQIQLGFALRASGETLYLKNPDHSRVLDAVRFEPQANGVASGRFPDGAPGFHELASRTPGAANAPLLIREIVINEIMYHPVSGDERDEFLELHNRSGATVDLGGWRLSDGVEFTFPEGTRIAPGGYLAVARDLARLLASHPTLTQSNAVGDFAGALANDGERIALAMPTQTIVTNASGAAVLETVFITVDEVTYGEGGRWGQWSDGGGSSLELIDPRSDNRLAANWADSDESRKSAWTTIQATGILDHGNPNFSADSLAVFLQGPGEALVDEVEVAGPSGNLIANGSFEGGLNSWTTRGTHVQSAVHVGEGSSGTRSLKLVATGRGDSGPNQVVTPLISPLTAGVNSTLRLKGRWLRGSPEILLKLHGNYLEAHGQFVLPRNLGTPGAPNSRALANAGPAVHDVAHAPVLPAAYEPIRITARVHDPDGIASVILRYREDPSVTTRSTNMVDNGLAGDAVAGDGIYTATIPGVAARHLVAFSIEAADNFFLRATARFPRSSPARECLVVAGEIQPPGSFGAYRIWFTEATHQEWATRHQGSNEPLDATFVYGNQRIIYNIGAYYSGSPFHWRGYNGPMANNCNYSLVFPPDDKFLGTTDFVLNPPANLGNDSTGQREQTFFWMASRLNRPFCHRRYVHVFVNGLRRGSATSGFIFEDAQQPNRDMVEQWFPLDPAGELYKIEDWFEYDAQAFGFNNVNASLENFVTTGGAKKLARYRWTWRKRAVRDSTSNYASLFRLVDALNAPATEDYARSVAETIDLGDWWKTIALRHAVGDWDAYGYRRGKNMYAYKGQELRWRLLDWDIAFAFGQGDSATTDPFSTIEPVIRRMFEEPGLRRAYLQALEEIADVVLAPDPLAAFVDERHDALRANNISVAAPAIIKSYAATRRGFLRGLLATNSAPFTITSHGGESFVTNRNRITLEGTAPLQLTRLAVNGVAYPVIWTSVTAWRMQIPLAAAINPLRFAGYDRAGQALSNATASLTITYTGPIDLAENHLVINEIMYHPVVDGAEYVEIHNTSATHTFDLSFHHLDGINFSFPEGALIRPQDFLVVAKNPGVFAQVYGAPPVPLGPFAGNLARGGETLALVWRPADSAQQRVIDRVTYDDSPPWPTTPDGSGPSLQLIDPFQDNDRVANWAAADRLSPAAAWQYASFTAPTAGNGFFIYLTEPGEVYVDEIALVAGNIPGSGLNLVRNGGFESDLAGAWAAGPGHAGSAASADVRFTGQRSLRLTATQAGAGTAAGAVMQTLSTPATAGQNYTLSFWYLPARGSGELAVRAGDGLSIAVPAGLTAATAFTPGQPNSVLASLPPFPNLWLNEILPDNLAGARDQAGDRDPWVELYNNGTAPVELADYYLSDNLTNLTRWPFPTGAVIGPGEFRMVWLDAEPFEATPMEWHASFRVAPARGSLVLSRTQPTGPAVLDALHYHSLTPDVSFGSIADGDPSQRQVLGGVSPAGPNTPPPPIVVRINEWMASNSRAVADPADGDFDDWFELYNPGATPVDLTGFTLTDDLANPTKFEIPAGYIIPAKGFLLVWADEETRQNGDGPGLHVNFRLSQAGEEIGLFTPAGAALDVVQFPAQTPDVSQGRYPDGAPAPWPFMTVPTPGQPNRAAPPPPQLRIVAVSATAAGFGLTWTASPGAVYAVEFKSDLSTPVWTPVGSPVNAVGPTASAMDPSAAGAPQRFYRVVRIN